MIIATAGHVDHGKTSLVAALTGIDTDRLPDEKRRGLTIDLGFAYLELPSGRIAGFIDVPGHERFVRNMVSGLSRVDLGLLAVAADDGVMPQTIEHVIVLSLLGVKRLVIAITKADRSDEERIEEVGRAAGSLAQEYGIDVRHVVPISIPDNTGIPKLRRLLESEADSIPEVLEEGGFRLAVDRSFVIRGAGLVVTGTVCSGVVRTGDRLAVLPTGREARVKTLHSQGRPGERALEGERAAINLAGLSRNDAGRGDWIVAPGILLPSVRIDADVTILASERKAFRHWTAVHVHHGTGHVTGRVALLEKERLEPGGSGLAQIRVDRPLVPAWGDRILLRDISARRTIGGARILDPLGPARGRARAERLACLRAADRWDHGEALQALLETSMSGFDPKVFLKSRNLDPDRVPLPEGVQRFGRRDAGRIIHERHWHSLARDVLEAVDRDHAGRLDRLGPTTGELMRIMPGSPDALLIDAVLQELCKGSDLARRGVVVHRPGHRAEPAPRDRTLWARVGPAIEVATGSPPSLHPLAAGLDLEPADLERFLDRMAAFGLVVKIARNRYLTPARIENADSAACRLVQDCPDGFSVADFRDAMGIGRNLAVDLLEFLDRTGVTWRRGDLRFSPDTGNLRKTSRMARGP